MKNHPRPVRFQKGDQVQVRDGQLFHPDTATWRGLVGTVTRYDLDRKTGEPFWYDLQGSYIVLVKWEKSGDDKTASGSISTWERDLELFAPPTDDEIDAAKASIIHSASRVHHT